MFLAVSARVAGVTDDERRTELGRLVKTRRLALKMGVDVAASRAGMSPVTWTRVESGERVRALTYAGIDFAVAWMTGGSLRFIETGQLPVTADDEATPTSPTHPGTQAAVTATGRVTRIRTVTTNPTLADATDAQLATELANRLAALRQEIDYYQEEAGVHSSGFQELHPGKDPVTHAKIPESGRSGHSELRAVALEGDPSHAGEVNRIARRERAKQDRARGELKPDSQ